MAADLSPPENQVSLMHYGPFIRLIDSTATPPPNYFILMFEALHSEDDSANARRSAHLATPSPSLPSNQLTDPRPNDDQPPSPHLFSDLTGGGCKPRREDRAEISIGLEKE